MVRNGEWKIGEVRILGWGKGRDLFLRRDKIHEWLIVLPRE